MMSQMQDKPLVNQLSDMSSVTRRDPYLSDGEMPTLLQRGPDRMATPRGPHQLIDQSHCERTVEEVSHVFGCGFHSNS